MNNWKVEITKVGKSEESWGGYFETEAEANEWLEEQKLKVGRRPERVVQEPVLDGEGNPTYNEVPRVDELGNPVYRVEYQYDEMGDVIEGSEVVTDEQIIDQVPIMQDVTLPAEATYEVIDNSAEAAREERLKAMEQEAAIENANIDFGKKLIGLIGTRNVAKGLTAEQINGMMADPELSVILKLLEVGRLGSAKPLIQAYTPDEVLITSQDKADYLQLLEDHKAKLGV